MYHEGTDVSTLRELPGRDLLLASHSLVELTGRKHLVNFAILPHKGIPPGRAAAPHSSHLTNNRGPDGLPRRQASSFSCWGEERGNPREEAQMAKVSSGHLAY